MSGTRQELRSQDARPFSFLGAFALALALGLAMACSLIGAAAGQEAAGRNVVVVHVDGTIGVSTTLYIEKGIDHARAQNAAALILRIDTPGGLVSSTREIVQSILASPVPIVGFVAPSGAHAASAGTYIMAATHIAAMAPGTQIGAATPIQLGAPPGLNPLAPSPDKDKEEKGKEPDTTTADRKTVNDAAAWMRSLGQLRGRNVEWLEKAVREAATLTADDALREHVIEIIAADIPDLVTKLDGRTVTIAGKEVKLETKDATIVEVERGWRIEALKALADPNIAFILLMIGVYGILFEFWNPGAVAPGVIGGIALVLALTALTALPLNYAGLALLLLGIGLMAAEAFTPGFGVLGFGGLAAFVLGAIFLFDPEASDIDIQIAWPVIVGAALTTLALLSAIVGFAWSARRRPALAGGEELIGAKAEVVDWQDTKGRVRLRGEIWSAVSDRSFEAGARVRVISREGLVVTVGPL